MLDIVNRLRERADYLESTFGCTGDPERQGAAEIKDLRAELARIKLSEKPPLPCYDNRLPE